jgi:hypothetical protein
MKYLLLIVFILVGCQTTKQTEKIVVSDTLRWNVIDTTHVVIKDTIDIIKRIDSIVFDTLYVLLDSVVVREVIRNANENIKVTFHYDTNLVLGANKLLRLKLNYDGDSLRIDSDLKQLIQHETQRERVEREEVKEWFPSQWIQYVIVIGSVILAIVFFIAWLRKPKYTIK